MTDADAVPDFFLDGGRDQVGIVALLFQPLNRSLGPRLLGIGVDLDGPYARRVALGFFFLGGLLRLGLIAAFGGLLRRRFGGRGRLGSLGFPGRRLRFLDFFDFFHLFNFFDLGRGRRSFLDGLRLFRRRRRGGGLWERIVKSPIGPSPVRPGRPPVPPAP